ncbi:MAG: fatty acyl-AMP ligase [Proteobacteria bacterium]|nr:fatty acyl-AMP ligase [Pseudomonadota bacterium]
MTSFREVLPLTAPAASGESPNATPTVNAGLAFRRGGFASLCEALDYAASGDTGLNFFDSRGVLRHVLSYARLRVEAQDFARRLAGAGLARGERLLLVAETAPAFCIAFFGAQYAGVVPVPVATPVGLGAKDRYIEQLGLQLDACGAAGILAPADLAAYARQAAAGRGLKLAGTVDEVAALPPSPGGLQPLSAGEACYVQFSSGSTRAPQGIDIRQDQLMANIDASIAAQRLGPEDSGVSWLPFYHDMGLIGFVLAPLCAQRSIDLMSPQDFARRPMQWLSLIARRRATVTYSPSFGYDLVVRRAGRQDLAGLDLSSLRLAGIGADMIQPAILDRFAETFAAQGFDRRAFLPSYGMAEVCVGLSFRAPLSGVRLDRFVDPRSGRSRDFVLCGRVIAGHAVEIRDADGRALGERAIGRLFARGPSVMPGYVGAVAPVENPVRDGWLDTGDLGYWCDGELVITGRAKDLIIVNGRNVWPQDIEWAIGERHPGSRGECCAFSIEADDTEKVIVLAEFRPESAAERDRLAGEMRQAVKETTGLDSQVVLVGRRPGLPRTTSGKLARTAARARFLAGAYD